MNERTKKLAIIANPSSQEIYESDSWQFNCAAWSADDLEKFAELILKQCLAYIDDSFGDVDYVKFMINRDFGVKDE